jgi:GNAT superfamily N-acetyltransferase
MIRELQDSDFKRILDIINEAAQAYKGVIPEDIWKEPYMPEEELAHEMEAGVKFYGLVEENSIMGVMGIQSVKDATLIRHAYVLTQQQRKGVGSKLLKYLIGLASTSKIMLGTWKDAQWAVNFYLKHGFDLVQGEDKNNLLRGYWDIPEKQVETSVVLKLEK